MILNIGNMKETLKIIPLSGLVFGVIAWVMSKAGLLNMVIPSFSIDMGSIIAWITFLVGLFVSGSLIVASLYIGVELSKLLKRL